MQEKNPISGWLVIDKEEGMTSTQVVSRLKHIFHPTKIGHAGTLDPFATGILPIAFGQATRTVPFVMDGLKTYRFSLRFGQATDTEDKTGQVVARSANRPTQAQIEAILPEFVGDIEQQPPAYSALKVKGKRAYDLARQGQAVDLPSRRIHIESLRLLSYQDDTAVCEVVCGKGTYVRSLGRDIALKLGTVEHLTALRRTSCGVFNESQKILLAQLEKIEYTPSAWDEFIPIQAVLTDILELALTEHEAQAVSHGQALKTADVVKRLGRLPEGTLLKATFDGKLIAFVQLRAGRFRPTRVFN